MDAVKATQCGEGDGREMEAIKTYKHGQIKRQPDRGKDRQTGEQKRGKGSEN